MADDHQLRPQERDVLRALFGLVGVDADEAEAMMDAGDQIEPVKMGDPADVEALLYRGRGRD